MLIKVGQQKSREKEGRRKVGHDETYSEVAPLRANLEEPEPPRLVEVGREVLGVIV